MAEVEERKPFITFSFTEEGNSDRYAGIYLHLPLEKPPTGEEIAIMVGTIKAYAKCWAAIQGKLGLAEGPPPGSAGLRGPQQESPEPSQDEQQAPSKPKPAPRRSSSSTTIRDPDSPATSKQCGMIRGLCGKLDSKAVLGVLNDYEVEGTYNKDGYYIPAWDSLNELTKGEASKIIEDLKQLEAEGEIPKDLPFD